MKIQHKFALYIFFTVVLFLIVFSFLSYRYNKNITIDTAKELMQSSVIDESGHLGERLIEKSKIAISMAASDTLLRELIKSNHEYNKLTDTARNTNINNLNSRWMNTLDIEDPFIKSYMHNPVASALRLQQYAIPDEIGEIFITNRYGLAIGTTKKLSTLAHSQKYWWKAAYNNGLGKIFFDDRGYDKSVGDYVIGIVIPIKENNQVIGILKCNFKLLASLSSYLNSIGEHSGREVLLIRSSGRIIIGDNVTPLSTVLPDNILKKIDISSLNSITIESDDSQRIVSYSPVGITYSSEKYSFGGRYKSNNRIGHADQKGWILVFTDDINSVLSSTVDTISVFIYAGLILALMAGVAALLMGRTIARPIRVLTERANRIGHGHIDEVIDINSTDELGILAQAFNQMSHDLRDTHSELQRKERLATLGQLTATVSHELRNPLGAMRPSLYILEKKMDKKNELVNKAIKRIDRNINRCDHIIDELLDFTRITELNQQTTLFDEWLNSVIDEQTIPEGILLEKKLNLKNIKISIDKDRLRRAVINVIENACHSMMDDNLQTVISKNARLSIKTRSNNKRIEILIADTGSGITEETLEKMFEPLFSTKAFGVGLGMPTIKQIMVQHDGDIEIDSEENKGTTVTLWIPVNPGK